MNKANVEIRITKEKGRGLFANSCYNKDDIIFQEVPLISCQFAWNEDYGYQACELCLRPLETALENVQRLSGNEFTEIPYPDLCKINKTLHVCCLYCGVNYCSSSCQQLAWDKYHKTLCHPKHKDNSHPLEKLKEAWKQMHFPPETASAMIFAKIFALIHQSNDKDSLKYALRQFYHSITNENENLTHKLMGIKFSEQIETLRQLVISSVPIANAEEWTTPEGFQHLLALVGINGQGIGTSSFGEWVKSVSSLELPLEEKNNITSYIEKIYENFENGVGEFLNNEGSGLYKLQSLINHSCKPNAEVTFPNSNYELAIKALTEIQVGDEICVSYLDPCTLKRSRQSRQELLKCRCEKCEEESQQQLDETSSDECDDLN